jgi:paraquat-inducible protein B
MSRRANPKIVGGFVLTAIALLVAAALVFGSFSFFETTRKFVVFFQGSVDGLTAGSQVLFRGVPLGKVVDVGIRYDPKDSSFEIPVIIEIRPGVIARFSPTVSPNTELMKELIDQGLRARLESASLVTGQQVVQLNFFPSTPVNLQKTDLPYFQLPTVPSPTQQIMSSVDAAARDLPTLIKQAGVVLDRVQHFLSPENEKSITAILDSTEAMMKTLQTDAEAVAPVIGRASSILANVDQLNTHLNAVVEDNRDDIRASVRNFRAVTVSINKLTDQLNQIVASNRMPIKQFTEGTLPDLTALIIDARTTVNKATAVLDSLERNPTRFIFGNRMGQGVELK